MYLLLNIIKLLWSHLNIWCSGFKQIGNFVTAIVSVICSCKAWCLASENNECWLGGSVAVPLLPHRYFLLYHVRNVATQNVKLNLETWTQHYSSHLTELRDTQHRRFSKSGFWSISCRAGFIYHPRLSFKAQSAVQRPRHSTACCHDSIH